VPKTQITEKQIVINIWIFRKIKNGYHLTTVLFYNSRKSFILCYSFFSELEVNKFNEKREGNGKI